MIDSDLAKIEVALRVRLPPDYRDFMTRASQCVYGQYLRSGLVSHPDMVIELTQLARERFALNYDVRARAEMDKPWPHGFVVVAEFDAGDFLFVMTGEKSSGVWKFDHENTGFSLYRLFGVGEFDQP